MTMFLVSNYLAALDVAVSIVSDYLAALHGCSCFYSLRLPCSTGYVAVSIVSDYLGALDVAVSIVSDYLAALDVAVSIVSDYFAALDVAMFLVISIIIKFCCKQFLSALENIHFEKPKNDHIFLCYDNRMSDAM